MRQGTKDGLSVAGWLVVGLIVLVVLTGVGLGIRWMFAPATGAVQQREQTVGSGAYRIQAYESFYEECGSALTTQQNLVAAQKQLNEAREEHADAARLMQLQANVAALQAQLNDAVNTYNVHARETDTRAHFLSSDLPYQLDPGVDIRCTA